MTIESTDGVQLQGELVRGDSDASSAVLFLHGFPSGDVRADKIGADMPELCLRARGAMGWGALAVRFRGCGDSGGNFSLLGWRDDAAAAIDFLKRELSPKYIWVVGFGTGGSVGLVASEPASAVSGVVVAGSPADFEDWAENPDRLLRHAREVGVIKDQSYPNDMERWSGELKSVRADEVAERFPPRPLMVVHGSEDEAVPHFDARLLADRHGAAELRVIGGAAHQLRHDPRAVAIILGWLARQVSD